MPSVAVDLSQLSPGGRNGGAARFVLDLLAALAKEPGLGLQLLVRPESEGAVEGLRASGAHVVVLGLSGRAREPRRLRRTLRRLPDPVARLLPDGASLRRLGADVLFSPLQSAAFHEPGLPHVAIAYDLQELSYPQNFPRTELRRRAAFRDDLRRCTHVVAISAATREDLVARAGLRPGRITVIPPVGPSERSRLAEADLRERLAHTGFAPGAYALCPANFWPHKNHARLLRAVAASPLPEDTSFRLVLCGAVEDGRREVEALVESLGLASRVRILGYQEEETLTALLQGARIVVLPSLFEGFGIPIVESIRFGVPVACSDLPAHREAGGDAVLVFDPTDEASLREALVRLWSDERLRQQLAERGLVRAARFPATSAAGSFAEVLRAAAPPAGGGRQRVGASAPGPEASDQFR